MQGVNFNDKIKDTIKLYSKNPLNIPTSNNEKSSIKNFNENAQSNFGSSTAVDTIYE